MALAGGVAAVALARQAWVADARARAGTLRRSTPRRLPGVVRNPLVRSLERAGASVTPENALLLWAAAVLVVAGSAATLGVAPSAVAGAATAAAGPAGLHAARHRRARAMRDAVPGVLEAVARDLRGGGTVGSALRGVAQRPGPLAAGAESVLSRHGLGLPIPAALERWAVELSSGAGGSLAAAGPNALAVVAATGGRAADALDALAAAQRDRLAVAAEARALASQARLSALVVGALPLVSLFGSVMTGGAAGRVLVATPFGRAALVAGLALEAAGVWWMRRIVAVEP